MAPLPSLLIYDIQSDSFKYNNYGDTTHPGTVNTHNA